jgi:hypothetical protein
MRGWRFKSAVRHVFVCWGRGGAHQAGGKQAMLWRRQVSGNARTLFIQLSLPCVYPNVHLSSAPVFVIMHQLNGGIVSVAPLHGRSTPNQPAPMHSTPLGSASQTCTEQQLAT